MKFFKLLKRHIKDAVYGANDGIITTFAVVSSVEGASLGSGIILAVGFASLFADGFSMASSGFLASKAEAARKKYEGEVYYKDLESPMASASFTFMAFVLVGVIPLVPYFFMGTSSSGSYIISCIGTAVALYGTGALRTKVTGGNSFRAGMEMLLIGGSAAVIAYAIGKLIEHWQ